MALRRTLGNVVFWVIMSKTIRKCEMLIFICSQAAAAQINAAKKVSPKIVF